MQCKLTKMCFFRFYLRVLSSNDSDQLSTIFNSVVITTILGSIIVTLNAKLLKAKISLTQSMTILGYSSFPLMVCAILVKVMEKIVRIPFVELGLCLFCCFLCIRAAFSVLATTIEGSKYSMVGFPAIIYYVFLTYLMILLI